MNFTVLILFNAEKNKKSLLCLFFFFLAKSTLKELDLNLLLQLPAPSPEGSFPEAQHAPVEGTGW